MSKIAQNKEKKRQAILSAAFDVFTTAGFVNAGMDKIAEKAQVTKQTVYRYFPSKEVLFKATLEKVGENEEFGFLQFLELSDEQEALNKFAFSFIQAHLLPDHIATFKLLIAENGIAPQMRDTFHGAGPDETDLALQAFFRERLHIAEPESLIRIWSGMLLALRTNVLMGMPSPSEKEINDYAQESTAFLFNALAGANKS